MQIDYFFCAGVGEGINWSLGLLSVFETSTESFFYRRYKGHIKVLSN